MFLLLTYNVFCVIIKKPHIVNGTRSYLENRADRDRIDVFDGDKKFLTVTAEEIITNYPATDGGVTTEMKELLATFFGENVEHAVGLGGLKTEKALINCVFTCTYEKK